MASASCTSRQVARCRTGSGAEPVMRPTSGRGQPSTGRRSDGRRCTTCLRGSSRAVREAPVRSRGMPRFRTLRSPGRPARSSGLASECDSACRGIRTSPGGQGASAAASGRRVSAAPENSLPSIRIDWLLPMTAVDRVTRCPMRFRMAALSSLMPLSSASSLVPP